MTGLLDLAVVIPTFDERANVATVVARLDAALADLCWEVIFVDDDSPDGTADAIRDLARVDRRVRVIQRIGRRGLSTACIEGMCATAAPLVAVMDGDLQHDEALLPRMAAALADPALDLAVGSRFVAGGGTGAWDRDRVAKSALATRLSRHVLRSELTDPMSGFFMVRTAIVRALVPQLGGIGFKILLDLMTASDRPLRFVDLPYTFRTRTAGESKLDHVVAMEYLIAYRDRRLRGARALFDGWVAFCLVCSVGAVANVGAAAFLHDVRQGAWAASALLGVFVGAVWNYALSSRFTWGRYR